MHYIIQENTFREANYGILTHTLDKFQLPYTTVRVYPYIDKITEAIPSDSFGHIPDPDQLPDIQVDNSKVFIFGSVKLANICHDKGWSPGSLVSDTHDFLHYGPIFKEWMLNSDSHIVTFFDLMVRKEVQNRFWKNDTDKIFIRPTHDGKLFDAGLFTRSEWIQQAESVRLNKPNLLMVYEKIQVATPKNVQKEVRVWVVNGKVITASQYRLNMSYCPDENVDPEALQFAQDMVNIHCIADAFVIDVCLHDDQWKIVELGCINSAGFYRADMQKVIIALEEFYS